MVEQKIVDAIRRKFEVLEPEFDERSRRIWAASEADSVGYGGIVAVSKATGLAESTIRIPLCQGRCRLYNAI